ncbi:hypothetical protein F2Q68_00005927 [Brassica cretica]|uniref:Uncharacterized protein n=1 Tax=Brassica cretica TaxID=69181 RepID=A0A8S9J7L8_BRACR|nr:hypothetical protein F2Q68_00005927 [Brassica cretica]
MDYLKSKVHPAFFVRDRRAMERYYEEFKDESVFFWLFKASLTRTHVYLFLKIRVSSVLSNAPYLLNRFDGIDRHDRYSNRNVVFFDINMKGLDGIQGPIYVGTGCVFRRQALHGFDAPKKKKLPGKTWA